MDIARLSSTAQYPSSYPVAAGNRGARERALELVTEVDMARPVRDPQEKVVQGEVLQRQRAAQYSSTRDYLNSRLFDAAAFTADTTDSGSNADPGTSGRAVGAYLSNTRELIQPDVNRGKQVDYFI